MKTLTALLLLTASLSWGQSRLSPQAEVSVLTMGPWQGQLFTAFGHSALRVHDPVNGLDIAFNYGVFDFNQPNFYLNFARGYNLYMLGVMDYKRFEAAYMADNRYIHEQVLNLTPERKQRLYDYLYWNAQPENKDYYYDYFYDNCATKIPEVVLKVFGDSIVFDGSYIKTDYSIRELTDLYLGQQPWGDLGIDIGLGLPTDKKATPYEHMFLPDYVESGFAHATILENGVRHPLVRETNIIYSSYPEERTGISLSHPLIVFTFFLLATIFLTYRDFRRKKLSMYFDGIVFAITGVVGLLLLFLWVFTNHQASAKNFNLLWALPTHIIAVIAFIRQPRWLVKYFLAVACITAALLIAWPLLPQKLHYALIPFVTTLGLRAYTQYKLRPR